MWVAEDGEVPEHVEQIAVVAQRGDQPGVSGAGVFGRVTVLDQVHKSLRLPVAGAGLSVDDPNKRSRADPRKSSPPLVPALSRAATYVERSRTAVSGWPASVLR
jgi:hypothetical protein